MAHTDAEMTGVVRRACYLMMLAAVAALTGCGNAFEHLTLGEWREVGQAQPPPVAADQSSFIVETTAPGDGPVINAGDLVKARVTVTTVSEGGTTRGNPSPTVAWVWTGRDSEPYASFATYGMLGGDRPRSTLIGRHLHEQFEISLPPKADPKTGDLPENGILAYPPSRLAVGASIKGQLVSPPEWRTVALRGEGGGNPSAQIEILEICPAAKVYRRTGTLNQLGMIFTVGDMKYANSLYGALGWTAIEAQCPAPDGHVRLQAGPFYYTDILDRHALASWSTSYISLRPARKHPDEWQAR
jgi:hypothetical protein